MSVELLEIAGLVAAAIALTALFHRALQPRLERLMRGRVGSPSFQSKPLKSRPVRPSRVGSPA